MSTMGYRSMTQPLIIAQVRESADPGGLLAHWERAMVGQLARETHAAGERFLAWPKAFAMASSLADDDTWTTCVPGDEVTHIVLTVAVATEKRPT